MKLVPLVVTLAVWFVIFQGVDWFFMKIQGLDYFFLLK